MMVHPDQKRWDEKFQRILSRAEAPEPHEWFHSYIEEWTGGLFIDLACGLSSLPQTLRHISSDRNGEWTVFGYVGVDVSAVALEWVQTQLEQRDIRGGVLQADLENDYPLVPVKATYLMTYFYSPYLFKRVSESAVPGSRVIAETYCLGDGEAPISENYCLDRGELRSYFSEWDVTLHEERTDDHPETARLVADCSR